MSYNKHNKQHQAYFCPDFSFIFEISFISGKRHNHGQLTGSIQNERFTTVYMFFVFVEKRGTLSIELNR